MRLFLPNGTCAIMYTLCMLYHLAPPLPEINLKLLGNILAFDLLYQAIYPDESSGTDKSILRQRSNDGRPNNSFAEQWADWEGHLLQILVKTIDGTPRLFLTQFSVYRVLVRELVNHSIALVGYYVRVHVAITRWQQLERVGAFKNGPESSPSHGPFHSACQLLGYFADSGKSLKYLLARVDEGIIVH